jgi:hypothetical protein
MNEMNELYSPYLMWVPGLGWTINRPALDRVTGLELEALARSRRCSAWPSRQRREREREPWQWS